MEEELILPDPDYVKSYDYGTGENLDLGSLVHHLKSLNDIVLQQNERIKTLEEIVKTNQPIVDASETLVRKTNKLAAGAWPFPSQRKS
jgi:hypothetical protein